MSCDCPGCQAMASMRQAVTAAIKEHVLVLEAALKAADCDDDATVIDHIACALIRALLAEMKSRAKADAPASALVALLGEHLAKAASVALVFERGEPRGERPVGERPAGERLQ
jgi:hypothetical protein